VSIDFLLHVNTVPAHPPLTLGKLDKPTFDDWVNAAAFVACHDQALFTRVMDKASKLAATFENTKPGITAPVGTESPPQAVKYSDDVHMLIIWHAAKRLQALVYEITNELDPNRRSIIPIDRYADRSRDILRWAQALEKYCTAESVQIKAIMPKENE
jgi:hypothetical protein